MEALLQKKAFNDHCSFDSKILKWIQTTQNILHRVVIVAAMSKNVSMNGQQNWKIQGGLGIADFQVS